MCILAIKIPGWLQNLPEPNFQKEGFAKCSHCAKTQCYSIEDDDMALKDKIGWETIPLYTINDWKPIIQLYYTTDMVVWAAIWYAVRMRYGKLHVCDINHFQVLLHVAQTGWPPLPLELAHSLHAILVSLYSQPYPSHSRPIGSYRFVPFGRNWICECFVGLPIVANDSIMTLFALPTGSLDKTFSKS